MPKQLLSTKQIESVSTSMIRLNKYYSKRYAGDMSIIFHHNALFILFDGRLKVSVSIRHLHSIKSDQ